MARRIRGTATMIAMRRYTVLGVAREGWPVIAGVVGVCAPVAAAAGYFVGGTTACVVAGVAAVVALWAVWFFRDPDRRTPGESGAVVSAADGVVCFVGPGVPPAESGVAGAEAAGLVRVSVFMNIFNVHVNRAPVAGVVERVAYKPGRFFNASLDKASEHNERLSLVLRQEWGGRFVVVQIAGLVARRIVCRVSEGARLAAGERFGLIRFGSRVDHYIPAGAAMAVSVGQRVFAGETVLARLALPQSGAMIESKRPCQGAAR